MEIDGALGVELLLGALLLLSYLWWRLSRGPGASLWSGARFPPVQGGWLPWVGCAVDFGREPLWYIKKTQEKLGDIFTIQVAGKWMTFIMDPNFYHMFFSSNSVDFQAAVLPICQGVAGLAPSSFAAHHSSIHDSLKGRLSSSTATLCPPLSAEFYTSLSSYGNSGEKELMDFVREAMFESVVRQLFGKNNVPEKKEDMMQMMKAFIKYDQDFEYGADLPEIFIRDWRDSKYKLLKQFKGVVDRICGAENQQGRDGGGTKAKSHLVLDMLLSTVDRPNAHNYALLLLWASQSNAIPAVFWTLCHVLSDPDCYKLAQEEVKNISLHNKGMEFEPLEEEKLKKAPHIKRCVLEAVRLHAPGMIVRKVVKTHTINEYTVPAGHLLMLSPYWSHRDQRSFTDPHLFKPERWLDCDLDRKQFVEGFVGFGGGRYQCPGKWFALMEMHLYVVMVIKMFDLELKSPMPEPSPLHLIGTQQPATSCKVQFVRKS